MSHQTALRPFATPQQVSALHALMTEPEQPVSGAPRYTPPASLLVLLLLSPGTPKDPKGE